MRSIKVSYRSFICRAIYNELEDMVHIYIGPNEVVDVRTREQFVKEYNYSNGMKIKMDAVTPHKTLECKKITGGVADAEFVNGHWNLAFNNRMYAVNSAGFAKMFKPSKAEVDGSMTKTNDRKIIVEYYDTKGYHCEPVLTGAVQGYRVYRVSNMHIAKKNPGEDYKSDMNLAKAVIKGIEESVWDDSRKVVRIYKP